MKYVVTTEVDINRRINSKLSIVSKKGRFYLRYSMPSDLITYREYKEQSSVISSLNKLLPHVFPKIYEELHPESYSFEYKYYFSDSLSNAIESGYADGLSSVEQLKIAAGIALAIKLSFQNDINMPILKLSYIFLDENNEPHIIFDTIECINSNNSIQEVTRSFSDLLSELFSHTSKKEKLSDLINCTKSQGSNIDEILNSILKCADKLNNDEYNEFNQYYDLINSNLKPRSKNNLDSLITACKRGNNTAIEFFNYLVDNDYVYEED